MSAVLVVGGPKQKSDEKAKGQSEKGERLFLYVSLSLTQRLLLLGGSLWQIRRSNNFQNKQKQEAKSRDDATPPTIMIQRWTTALD